MEAPVAREYVPNSWAQERILFSTAPEVAVSGGWFSGKTWPACLLALAYADENPGARVALCREEFRSMRASTLLCFKDEILPLSLLTWDAANRCGWKESEAALFLPRRNGRQSVVYAMGMDKPHRLLSMSFALVIVDQAEQLSFEQFRMAKGRAGRQVGMPNGRIVLLFNPDHEQHWANQRYRFDLGSRIAPVDNGRTTAEVVNCDPSDNLENADERYLENLESAEGVWRERYRLNRWVSFEGSVFAGWSADRHIVDAPTSWAEWGGYPPPNWKRTRGIDFGWNNPFVCQWWAESPDGVFYRYREIYRSQRLVQDHAADIVALEQHELLTLRNACPLERVAEFGPYLSWLNVTGSFADHDAEDRATLAKHGVKTSPAIKDLMPGIQTCVKLMAQGRLLFVRGAGGEIDARLRSEKLPTSTEEEMTGYRWRKLPQSVNPKDDNRDVPVDANNHGIDAMRYVLHSLAMQRRVMVVG